MQYDEELAMHGWHIVEVLSKVYGEKGYVLTVLLEVAD